MILPWLIVSLLLGGGLAWLAGRWSSRLPRWISLLTLAAHCTCVSALWIVSARSLGASGGSSWLISFDRPWIPEFGVHFHLGLDGLSLLLIVLSDFLGVMALLASWREIHTRIGFYHFNLLAILAALIGVFLALDLLLFYVFWEVMLVPLYFLIAIWGHQRRLYAAMKFFIFTQASGLLMLLAIIGLYYVRGRASGVISFDYFDQLALASSVSSSAVTSPLLIWIMLGFCAALAVKLPVVPFHTWLPDAHTEAPTAGSVYLAGLVLKAGAYGFLRFLIPLFPAETNYLAPYAMVLGVVGILYGGVVAMGQSDLKRLVAYTSVSHMGFVLLGIFSWNQLSLQGAVLVMISHGVSTGALFILVGGLYFRTGSRELSGMGGLWSTAPRMGGWAMVFAMASLGLPALGNFVGEFLVLLGVYQRNVPIAVMATLGFVVATAYSLWMMQRVFFGPNRNEWQLPDLSLRENTVMAAMTAVIVWLGLFPQPVLNTSREAISRLRRTADREAVTGTDPLHGRSGLDADELLMAQPRENRP